MPVVLGSKPQSCYVSAPMAMNKKTQIPQKKNSKMGTSWQAKAKPQAKNSLPQANRTSSKASKSSAGATGLNLPAGLIYLENFIQAREKEEILKYLHTLYPIWELRYSKNNPPPEGQQQRPLLRPVYWLGNWQFACLNYYHPPKGLHNRCVQAEPYPPILDYIVKKVEALIRQTYSPRDIPHGWHLNTCLINFYGDQITADGKRIDCARVGEHKDFEPGPVASISFGERAFFQFVSSNSTNAKSTTSFQQWLDDSSLQVFGGDKFKKHLFHRVQRVEKKNGFNFKIQDIDNFETRRINFTFRYVPTDHVTPFHRLSPEAQQDVHEYMTQLAVHSEFFKSALNK